MESRLLDEAHRGHGYEVPLPPDGADSSQVGSQTPACVFRCLEIPINSAQTETTDSKEVHQSQLSAIAILCLCYVAEQNDSTKYWNQVCLPQNLTYVKAGGTEGVEWAERVQGRKQIQKDSEEAKVLKELGCSWKKKDCAENGFLVDD